MTAEALPESMLIRLLARDADLVQLTLHHRDVHRRPGMLGMAVRWPRSYARNQGFTTVFGMTLRCCHRQRHNDPVAPGQI
jgi:hypothetical protein